MVPHVSSFIYMGLQKCGVVVVVGGNRGGDYSSLTAALINLIFGMHTPISSIGVVGSMNLNFEVIKCNLWEIFSWVIPFEVNLLVPQFIVAKGYNIR